MSLLIAAEVAGILRVSTARVYELVRLRMLPALKIGQRQLRFDEKTLREWIEGGGSCVPVASNRREVNCSHLTIVNR
jgi:excisionase family DNA binding protein